MIRARFASSPTGYLHIGSARTFIFNWLSVRKHQGDPAFTEASIEGYLRRLAEERGVKAGVLINASRAASTGQPVGPSAFTVFVCVGRNGAIQRLRRV